MCVREKREGGGSSCYIPYRAELETSYVKGLMKVIKKAKSSNKRCVSTMEPAWANMVAVMEAEAEAHKTLAASLSADCAKALKTFTEQQIKQREQVMGGYVRVNGVRVRLVRVKLTKSC